jgi:hypothetical protein
MQAQLVERSIEKVPTLVKKSGFEGLGPALGSVASSQVPAWQGRHFSYDRCRSLPARCRATECLGVMLEHNVGTPAGAAAGLPALVPGAPGQRRFLRRFESLNMCPWQAHNHRHPLYLVCTQPRPFCLQASWSALLRAGRWATRSCESTPTACLQAWPRCAGCRHAGGVAAQREHAQAGDEALLRWAAACLCCPCGAWQQPHRKTMGQGLGRGRAGTCAAAVVALGSSRHVSRGPTRAWNTEPHPPIRGTPCVSLPLCVMDKKCCSWAWGRLGSLCCHPCELRRAWVRALPPIWTEWCHWPWPPWSKRRCAPGA